MATSVSKGQIPFRDKGRTSCIHHQDRNLVLYCEKCQELACIKCLSNVHKNHTMCDLSEITPQKKEDIHNFVDKTENVDLVQINQLLTFTDSQLMVNVSHFEELSHQLRRQTNKLKEDLDLLTAQTLSLYKQMEEDNTKLLQTYKHDLEKYSTQLKNQVQECKIALQRGSDIQIYDKGCDIQSSVTIPVKPTLGKASFSPNRNPQAYMKQALGETYIASQERSKGRKDVTSSAYTLLPQTKVLGEWKSPCYITSVCPTTDGQVWTSNYGSDILTLLDRNGKAKQGVKHNTVIRDISLSHRTNTLWICDQENNIAELMLGRLVHRFSTMKRPYCICITASNHVIVGMAKHTSKFNTEGALILTTWSAGTGDPLVSTPHRIAECPVTHNVAVADLDSIRDGGKGKPHVVVIDTEFKELFKYHGEIQEIYQPTSQSGSDSFDPYSVMYDSAGNLVIGDCNNRRILLISGGGEFLRIIHTDDISTKAVGVVREGVLCAVFGANNVKLLQYNSTLNKQRCIIS